MMDNLRTLSIVERIRLVEDLWDSIASDQAALSLTDEQRAELDRRLDAYEANPEQLLTWDQVLEQLRGRL